MPKPNFFFVSLSLLAGCVNLDPTCTNLVESGELELSAAVAKVASVERQSIVDPKGALFTCNDPHKYLDSPWGRLHYFRCGQSSCRVLVLPGSVDHGFTHRRFAQELAFGAADGSGCEVVVLDLPGKGYSDYYDTYRFTLEERARVLVWAMRALDLGNRVHVVAHSSAGVEALHLLSRVDRRQIGVES
ncbi:MAG: alpha/beta hydrolase, partial [Myxococcales bacterium]|nr:alpha/beta hydrolase [Myxococcales bacterium]